MDLLVESSLGSVVDPVMDPIMDHVVDLTADSIVEPLAKKTKRISLPCHRLNPQALMHPVKTQDQVLPKKLINCSEINDFSFVVGSTTIRCNKMILAHSSKFFHNIIIKEESSFPIQETDSIEIHDYNEKIVEEIVSHTMALSNKKIQYIMKQCDLAETESQLQFCLQYGLTELETKLLNMCVDPKTKYGKFTPESTIRIGVKHHSNSLIQYGVDNYEIDINKIDSLMEEISKNNKVVTQKLLVKIINQRDFCMANMSSLTSLSKFKR